MFIDLMAGVTIGASGVVGAVNWAAGNWFVGGFFALWGALLSMVVALSL